MTMSRILGAMLTLLVPASAFAGHVHSPILQEGSPLEWWRENKDAVLARLEKKEVPLADRLGPDERAARLYYVWGLVLALGGASEEARREHWRNGSERPRSGSWRGTRRGRSA
jgi:hypothetical protein